MTDPNLGSEIPFEDKSRQIESSGLEKDRNTEGPSLFLLVGMGFNLVADIVGCTFVGFGLDFVLKSYPVLTSIGVFSGIAVASVSTWLLMRKYLK